MYSQVSARDRDIQHGSSLVHEAEVLRRYRLREYEKGFYHPHHSFRHHHCELGIIYVFQSPSSGSMTSWPKASSNLFMAAVRP